MSNVTPLEWIRRLWGTVSRHRTDEDLEQELRLHIELAADAQRNSHAGAGTAPAMAPRENHSRAMDALRDQRGLPWLDDLLRDLSYGVRGLVRARGFALTAIITLALGIGANTAIFSIIDAVILRRLPVPNPEQLVSLTDPAVGGAVGGLVLGERDHVSYSEFRELRLRMRSFSGMFAAQTYAATTSARIDGPEEDVRTKLVSGNYFAVLGVTPVLGRVFSPEDDEKGPGGAPYAVISYAYWQRRFAGERSVLDARLQVGDTDLAIIGVAPPGFRGESVEASDAWIPFVMQRQVEPAFNMLGTSNIRWLHAVGRLAPGTSLQQAQAEADVVFGGMLRELSATFDNPGIAANVLKQHLVVRDASRGISTTRGTFSLPLYILMGFVALVLAIACASVATLLLARVELRQKELDVRQAIGASRFRLFRQLMTESVVLSTAAGLVGTALAWACVRMLIALVLADQPGAEVTAEDLGIGLDLRTLAFSMAVCLLTVVGFGLTPAWSAARRRTPRHPALSTAAAPVSRSGYALVAVQVALSVMLLIGAGWFVRTLRNLETANLGYDRQVAQLRVDFRNGGYERTGLQPVYEALRERLAGLPGVRSATYSSTGLLGYSFLPISVDGPGTTGVAGVMAVGPDHFQRLGTAVLRGRGIAELDAPSSVRVCVINEALASQYFGDDDPIGRHVMQGNNIRYQIIGVIADARDLMTFPLSFGDMMRADATPTYYTAVRQPTGQNGLTLSYQLVTAGDPAAVMAAARAAIESFNRGLTVTTATTLDEQIDRLLREERLIAQLASVIGGVALLLACVGLYGLLSHIVARRTNEIGVRMALGAQRRTIVSMVLRTVAMLVLVGLAIGVPASMASSRLVRSQVFGLGAADPQTLAGAAVIMLVVAALAGYLPARRAARVDPLTAIRTE